MHFCATKNARDCCGLVEPRGDLAGALREPPPPSLPGSTEEERVILASNTMFSGRSRTFVDFQGERELCGTVSSRRRRGRTGGLGTEVGRWFGEGWIKPKRR